MSSPFDVRQVEARFQAFFVEPVFDIFKDLPALLARVYEKLRFHGARLSDMKFEPGGENLGDVSLRCLIGPSTVVRISMDGVEVSSVAAFNDIMHQRVVVDSIEAVMAHLPEPSFKSYVLNLALHGVVSETPPTEFLAQFVTAGPQGLGPLLGSGAIFYYGAESERLAASVMLDLSRGVEGGIFIQTNAIYDASKISFHELAATAARQLGSTLKDLGLILRTEDEHPSQT